MQLFHRTSIGDARAVIHDGFRDQKWRFGRDEVTGALIEAIGVWMSDRPLSTEEGPQGDAVVEIELAVKEEDLAGFEVFGPTSSARLWVVPAALVNSRGSVRIHEVDPRGSWFHEAVGRPNPDDDPSEDDS